MQQPVRAITIVREPDAPAGGAWIWVGGAAGVTLVAVGAWVLWRQRVRRDPLGSAWRKLARRAGLTRAQRSALQRWASRADVPHPVVLLVSGSARRRAAAAAQADLRVTLEIEERLKRFDFAGTCPLAGGQPVTAGSATDVPAEVRPADAALRPSESDDPA